MKKKATLVIEFMVYKEVYKRKQFTTFKSKKNARRN